MNDHFLRWFCAELVDLLLRPVFCRAARQNTDLAWKRFTSLVNAANCWPCCIEWREGPDAMIWIYRHSDDAHDSYFDPQE